MIIDDKSLTPIFIQIAEWVKQEIFKGNLREEEQIPSTNQFATMYRINPATVGKGFNLLVEEDILYKKRGIGMFVKTGAREVITKHRKDMFQNETLKSVLAEAQSLGISSKELIEMIKKEMN